MRVSVIGNPSAAALAVAGVGASAVGKELGVVYGERDGHELVLDLYRPAGEGRRPGLVFVHGGGWRAGSREHFAWHAEEAARLGYVAVSIDYRLIDQALWPAALDDCQRAVRWLRSRADELGLDPDRVGAYGSSAGGHLVACLGVRETRAASGDGLDGFSSRVSCVIDIHGVHHFPSMGGTGWEPSVALLGGGPDECPDAWRDASPIEFVDQQSAAILLVHDPGDPVVPYEQSVAFAAALMRAGRPVEMLPVPGAGHGFTYGPQNAVQQQVWPVALAWLARHLGG